MANEAPTSYPALTSSVVVSTEASSSYLAFTGSMLVSDKPPMPIEFSTYIQIEMQDYTPSRVIIKVPRNPTTYDELDFVAIPLEGVRPMSSRFSATTTRRRLVWQKVPRDPVAGLDFQKRQS